MVGMTALARAADEPPVPPLTGPVVDRASIIPPAAARAIEALALELKQKTGAEIAVLTMPTVAPATPFDYGMRVVETWKLGEAGKDNGLLLLVAVGERQVRFFTGYGLEGPLPDGKLGAILDRHATPAFRHGDFATGIHESLRAAAQVIAADAGVELTRPVARPADRLGVREVLLLLLILWLLFGLPGLVSRRRGLIYPPIHFGGGLRGGLRGGFGGGFGRSFPGGFGGGGRFGGGGAGRSW